MPKYQPGDIVCTTRQRDDGRFQGEVRVKASVFEGPQTYFHLCPEIDDSKEDAMRRAIKHVKVHFPPE